MVDEEYIDELADIMNRFGCTAEEAAELFIEVIGIMMQSEEDE